MTTTILLASNNDDMGPPPAAPKVDPSRFRHWAQTNAFAPDDISMQGRAAAALRHLGVQSATFVAIRGIMLLVDITVRGGDAANEKTLAAAIAEFADQGLVATRARIDKEIGIASFELELAMS